MTWTTVATETFEDSNWIRPTWTETVLNPNIEDFENNVAIKYGTGKLYGVGWKYGQHTASDWQPITWSETPLYTESFEVSATWLSNWNTYGTNYSLSTAQSVSPTHSWMGVGVTSLGETRFLYAGNTSILNQRIVAQFRNANTGDWQHFLARWSSVNPIVNGYDFWFEPWERGGTYVNYITMNLNRYNNGSVVRCFNASVPLALSPNTWHKVRLSITTEYDEVLLRFEFWTGSAWSTLYDFRDNSPLRILSAGRLGFGMQRCQTSNQSYFDDVQIISLA
jgi:hypothetical protein